MAVALEHGRDEVVDLRGLADVRHGHMAATADLLGGAAQDVLAPAHDHHLGSAARQLRRRGLAEVRAATGDECDLAGERAVGEHARGALHYSPITLITRRLGRPPSNSQ